MTISYNWLHHYLPITLTPEELSIILTSVGLEVESMERFETIKGGLKGLVVGRVEECMPHPNADKLRLTKVNIGADSLLNIVCGAPNVAAGQKVIVATIGATIYPTQGDPLTMKRAKIRGEESEGMICAEDEIGLGDSHDGILVLPEDASIGMPAADYFKLPEGDIVYEIGLTPNRMDAMSHMGVARDVCAYLTHTRGEDYSICIQDVKFENANQNSFDIKIEDHERCARYAGLTISGITVQDSPEWMQLKLKAIGLRPINVIVDVTNYVMHECGQPLHAFDLSAIKGNVINVKTVADQTSFVTLDGKEIKLHKEDLMICNAEEPMCIAGVYGGLNSGVKNSTTSIFLESAWFLPDSIRKSSMRHGLRTDAATRFEKGADISQVEFALKRATQLILELAGGHLTSAFTDIYPTPRVRTSVKINNQKIRSLAGKAYSDVQINTILNKLGFEASTTESSVTEWTVPFSKPDITMQADIVEEVMRIDGLDNIPFTGKINYSLSETTQGFKADSKQYVATQLVAKGFFELFTNSITNATYYPSSDSLVKMINSLSANLDTMRPSMLETGLEAIAYNLNRKNNQLKFFEFGKIYTRHQEQFIETEQLAIYLTGQYRPTYYTEKAKPADMFMLRGIVESLFPTVKLSFESAENGLFILYRNNMIGKLLKVDAVKLKSFDIKQDVWYAELNWQVLKTAIDNHKQVFSEIPRFPTMLRDLALVVDKSVSYQSIEIAIKQAKSKLLQTTQLFDVFENEKLGQGKVSYAINFSFYHPERTLIDIEVEAEMKAIITSLEMKVGASIRS
jgi:phenylalanyl-tRNA synthetase beta chain